MTTMKKMNFTLISLAILFSTSSLILSQKKTSRSFEKSIVLEIACNTDSSLFAPYSNAWLESWIYSGTVVESSGTILLDKDKYLAAFTKRNENLWTLLHPQIIQGKLTIYSPFDPGSITAFDNGALRYPIKGDGPNDNFFNASVMRDKLCYYLGRFGPEPFFPILNMNGEDSVLTFPDGSISFVYPPRDYLWYHDKEIVKYKVRIRVYVNKQGKETKRNIQSIAPVAAEQENGEINNGRELFWLDYNEVKPLLKTGYFFDKQGKPVTYLKYIEGQVRDHKVAN